MIIFPNCKINLGLRVLNLRYDGFHDIQTIFYPVPWTDCLEVIENKDTHEEIVFTQTGLNIDGESADNLCVKAYHLLKNDFNIPKVKMHLHKVIPMGAGLGGGSSDGAFALMLLNRKFNLQIPGEKLMMYALKLGSDCPFFIKNSPQFAEDRGDQMQNSPLDLKGYHLTIIYPGLHINTANAYQALNRKERAITEPGNILQLPSIESWKEKLINDFEPFAFQQFPELEKIKSWFYEQGAIYSSMSGSGSAIYAISKEALDGIEEWKEYKVFNTDL